MAENLKSAVLRSYFITRTAKNENFEFVQIQKIENLKINLQLTRVLRNCEKSASKMF